MFNKHTWMAVVAGAVLALNGCAGDDADQADAQDELQDSEGKADSTSTPKTIVVTEKKNGKTVTARVGDTVDVQLSGNPTTGYQWFVVSYSRDLPVANQEYIPSQPIMTGSGGIFSFQFKPDLLAAGAKHTAKFAYYRPWMGVDSAIQTFSITIKVKDAPQPECTKNSDCPEAVGPGGNGFVHAVCQNNKCVWPVTPCDPSAYRACGDAKICVASDLQGPGTCKDFEHGQTVGRGYTCGGSIGVGCAIGLNCDGLPQPPLVGGTGICN
jgi:inhibitor of cysteine peptidase